MLLQHIPQTEYHKSTHKCNVLQFPGSNKVLLGLSQDVGRSTFGSGGPRTESTSSLFQYLEAAHIPLLMTFPIDKADKSELSPSHIASLSPPLYAFKGPCDNIAFLHTQENILILRSAH